MIDRLKCGNCHKVILYKERVFLNVFNTIVHQRCYKPIYRIKDRGTYGELIERYDFLEQFKRQ